MDLDTLRHSCSHVMAQAVKQLWPETRLGIGPSIEDGFYYDFDRQEPFSEKDLSFIEAKMEQIIAKGEPFVKQELGKQEASKLFTGLNENYKVELINNLEDDKVTIYKTGEDFFDLCRGPHVETAAQIKAFKLLSVAGAYWHGIETNPMLQRIYGTCYQTQKQLDEHLKNLEEAKKRDHRKLGPQLGLFNVYHEEAGAGLVFYHPKGAILRTIIEDYLRKEHSKRGYDIVITPHIMKASLWHTSGHYEYYIENMYTFNIEEREFVLKPMNCPGHILIYKSKLRSYRDLPMRLFELGTVYRHEKDGVLHGLMRVRGFTQDDAHIFCKPDQLQEEIIGIIDFVLKTMNDFGFPDLSIELSTRPEKSIGTDQDWSRATDALKEALKEKNLVYTVCSREGAFYGPKIDIKIKDALKRKWQCATIQCDFALPARFDLQYIDDQGKGCQPIMLHRVILGSLERFVGVLVEHYAGALPLWLSPVQAIVMPIKSELTEQAQKIKQKLQAELIRTEIDARNITLHKKIREAEINKVPYLLVVGDKEIQSQTVSVRKRGAENIGSLSLEDLISRLKKEIDNKAK